MAPPDADFAEIANETLMAITSAYPTRREKRYKEAKRAAIARLVAAHAWETRLEKLWLLRSLWNELNTLHVGLSVADTDAHAVGGHTMLRKSCAVIMEKIIETEKEEAYTMVQ